MWDLCSQTGIELVPLALDVWSLNHKAAREIPGQAFFDRKDKIDSGFIGAGLKEKKSPVNFTRVIEEKMEVVVIVKQVRTEQSCKKIAYFWFFP